MNIIVNVDEEWGIGKENELLVHIPADMKFFRQKTTGKVIIMGRKTLESFPGGKPLKNRTNIVITRDCNYKVEEAIVVNSIEAALLAAKNEMGTEETDDVFVIGGASIYQQMLGLCEIAFVTKVAENLPKDAYFPNLDQMEEWSLIEQSEVMEHEGLEFVFTSYQRK